jgi:haloacetate dehalogenase
LEKICTLAAVFDGFAQSRIDTGEAEIHVRHGGRGPPLLLLHGYPQTHAMWHAIAPRLAEQLTVVAPDLRGYGASSKPPTTRDHEPYSKRAMARDQVAVMRALGHEQFAVCGHDRGGRCAYRLALDAPERVTRLAVLDIIPTGEVWRRVDMRFALSAWHWSFLAAPYDLPERMIATDPDAFYLRGAEDRFDAEALDDYRRSFREPACIHAMCEDYRAGATLDHVHDEADRGARRIGCSMLVLWGSRGSIARVDDVLGVWREWADDVRGGPVDSGHYLAEEAPDATCEALLRFFTEVPA